MIKTLCLNLKQSTDRREHCQKQFDREGIEATFIQGLHGRENGLKHEQDWITCQVGACIAHYIAVEEVRHNNYGVTLVLEDDIYLPENFKEKIQVLINDLPEDWDVACLSYFAGDITPEFQTVNKSWHKQIGGRVWGQAAYLVNGEKGAAAILNCITPFRSHIDRMFWECCRDNLMNGYFTADNNFIKQGWDFPSLNA